jgi:hypothetical protein
VCEIGLTRLKAVSGTELQEFYETKQWYVSKQWQVQREMESSRNLRRRMLKCRRDAFTDTVTWCVRIWVGLICFSSSMQQGRWHGQVHLPTYFFFLWCCGPTHAMTSSFLMFLDHTQRRNIFGRTPLDEWLARRRDLCLTTHNTNNRLNIHFSSGIRIHNLSRQAAAGQRHGPRRQLDRLTN